VDHSVTGRGLALASGVTQAVGRTMGAGGAGGIGGASCLTSGGSSGGRGASGTNQSFVSWTNPTTGKSTNIPLPNGVRNPFPANNGKGI
jgi:hypothetical protein